MDWKELDEAVRSLFEVVSRQLPGGTGEHDVKPHFLKPVSCRDLNRESPEYKSGALPIDKSVQWLTLLL
jgi:hypothetical protein